MNRPKIHTVKTSTLKMMARILKEQGGELYKKACKELTKRGETI